MFYGEMRVGEADPSYLSMDGGREYPPTAARDHGELALQLDGEQTSGVTQAVFVDILRSDEPLAVRVRAWDGTRVLAESDWLNLAAFRQELITLLR